MGRHLQLQPPRSKDFAGNISRAPREQFAALEFRASTVMEELRRAPGARQRNHRPYCPDDGGPRSESLAAGREDREAGPQDSNRFATQTIVSPRAIGWGWVA